MGPVPMHRRSSSLRGSGSWRANLPPAASPWVTVGVSRETTPSVPGT
ncbi:hypothetical protein SGM_1195 [Streptomyces griseoaurantiacus M045]|uniref:Uncharacterized protein n=1 Tax=Streptomyces griseoaurantiacus M045 TaxID=996637 RepID=F3NDI1_9ACTN|nr:hypothetical protein SGM_1195 [Streptomyces griseoaurantiacus M045]